VRKRTYSRYVLESSKVVQGRTYGISPRRKLQWQLVHELGKAAAIVNDGWLGFLPDRDVLSALDSAPLDADDAPPRTALRSNMGSFRNMIMLAILASLLGGTLFHVAKALTASD
jgi:hypothetical protein